MLSTLFSHISGPVGYSRIAWDSQKDPGFVLPQWLPKATQSHQAGWSPYVSPCWNWQHAVMVSVALRLKDIYFPNTTAVFPISSNTTERAMYREVWQTNIKPSICWNGTGEICTKAHKYNNGKLEAELSIWLRPINPCLNPQLYPEPSSVYTCSTELFPQ